MEREAGRRDDGARTFTKRLPVWLTVLAVALVASCDSCRPSQGNFAFVGYWDFPSGETYTFDAEFAEPSVEFRARVYYPSYDESVLDDVDEPDLEGIEVADGQHPMIVFGHGQYGFGDHSNYVGMTNLMYHLASWGYICVSVDLDVVHGNWSSYQWGIPHRGELLLEAVDRMLQLNTDAGSLFYQTIDPSQIALIGHSRGGGGAISAVNANLAAGSPRSIVALATISPVDFGTNPLQAPVPHLSLYGTWDGDLLDGEGPRIWDGGVRTAPKEHVLVYGANHFHFTDAINHSGENNEISREDHQEIAQGFINAWFDVHVRGNDRYDWPLYLAGEEDMRPGVDYYLQILSDDFLAVDDGNPLGTEATNSLGGTNTFSSLALFDDQNLTDFNDHFYNTSEGLLVHWDDTGDELLLEFNPQNLNTYERLEFRVTQRPGSALNTLNTFKDFRVRLRDAASNTAVVPITTYLGGVPYPDSSGSLSAVYWDYQYKAIMRSYRIPLADFTGVNLAAVREVAFLFDRPNQAGFVNATGAVAMDDIEFTR